MSELDEIKSGLDGLNEQLMELQRNNHNGQWGAKIEQVRAEIAMLEVKMVAVAPMPPTHDYRAVIKMQWSGETTYVVRDCYNDREAKALVIEMLRKQSHQQHWKLPPDVTITVEQLPDARIVEVHELTYEID